MNQYYLILWSSFIPCKPDFALVNYTNKAVGFLLLRVLESYPSSNWTETVFLIEDLSLGLYFIKNVSFLLKPKQYHLL